MIRRILAVLYARNLEYLRDRSTLGWNIVLPVLLVFGLAFVFSGGPRPLFKVGVITNNDGLLSALHPFLETPHVDFYAVTDRERAIGKVSRHQVDLLLDLRPGERRYWVSGQSPKGQVLERLLASEDSPTLRRESVTGREIRYVDWLVPGVLGMNIMFSCLFGVGYVIVRYRKSGFLKRLHATPLSAAEFLIAQLGSRMLLITVTSTGIFVATDQILDFRMEGSYLTLVLVFVLGTVAMLSLGLVIAARVSSEELAGGLLNLLSWPMMIVSGVWFSLEGTPEPLRWLAQLSPLTHMLDGAREVMLDGAGLFDVWDHLAVLALMSAFFLGVGALSFRWIPE